MAFCRRGFCRSGFSRETVLPPFRAAKGRGGAERIAAFCRSGFSRETVLPPFRAAKGRAGEGLRRHAIIRSAIQPPPNLPLRCAQGEAQSASPLFVGAASAAKPAEFPRPCKQQPRNHSFDCTACRNRDGVGFAAEAAPTKAAPTEAFVHSRKISHAATAISAKPAQWFHFSDWSRYVDENTANTSSVITSCMPLSCGAE